MRTSVFLCSVRRGIFGGVAAPPEARRFAFTIEDVVFTGSTPQVSPGKSSFIRKIENGKETGRERGKDQVIKEDRKQREKRREGERGEGGGQRLSGSLLPRDVSISV